VSEPDACGLDIIYSTILTLAFLAIYVASAKPDGSIKQLLRSAERFCHDDTYSQEFCRRLANIVFCQYELFVSSAPWKRYLATVILREICMILTVCIFDLFLSSLMSSLD